MSQTQQMCWRCPLSEGISELSVSVQLEVCSMLHSTSVLEWCGGAFEKGSDALHWTPKLVSLSREGVEAWEEEWQMEGAEGQVWSVQCWSWVGFWRRTQPRAGSESPPS